MKFRKKRMILISAVIIVLLAAIGLSIWFVRGRGSSAPSSGQSVYVTSVASIMGLESGNGMISRYSGVVEPQKTWNIELSSENKVDEIYVKEGDEVKTGDKLFIYDTAEMEENLAQAEIDLERIKNEIETTNTQLADLRKEKAAASADDQLEYTTRIMTAENTVKRSEYESKSKQSEIDQLKKNRDNAVVTSEMDGVVKSINSSGEESMTGDTEAFMTILATGSFRIKGSVNEQNISSIIEGQAVIVHSRVDEEQIWRGTLTAVDLENPNSNQNNDYYSSDSSGENSSSYPFYVDLDSVEGLMLGQHVYIEMDYGQTETKEGIWLEQYYIEMEEEEPFVWAANDRDRIEKRKVTLGEYDEDLMKYEVVDGLTKDDYIAFPDVTVEEGAVAEKNIENMSSSDSDQDEYLGDDDDLNMENNNLNFDDDDDTFMDDDDDYLEDINDGMGDMIGGFE